MAPGAVPLAKDLESSSRRGKTSHRLLPERRLATTGGGTESKGTGSSFNDRDGGNLEDWQWRALACLRACYFKLKIVIALIVFVRRRTDLPDVV